MPTTAYAPRAKLTEAPGKGATRARGGSATGPRLRPTATVGEPYPFPPPPPPPAPGLQVPEPAALVGMQTGQHYATLGDNPMGPETMQVTPPPGAPMNVQPAPGLAAPVSMEGGGTATVGPYGWGGRRWLSGSYPSPVTQQPQQPQPAYTTNNAQPNYGAAPVTPNAPAYDQNQFDWLRRSVNIAQESLLDAQGRRLDARAANMPYSYASLGAREGLIAPQYGQLSANRAVLGARGNSLAAKRGLIGQEQGANAAELADIQAVRAARANTPDKVAVAQESQLRNQVDRSLYNRIGVEAPTVVDVEPGQEGSLPANMRAKLKTQEDIKTQQGRDNAEVRQNQINAARLAVELIGTNETQAELVAQEAGLTLQEAKLLVDQADNAESRAKLGETEAELGEGRARLGESRARYALGRFDDPKEFEGYELYTDPVTLKRSWLTPAEADRRKFDYSQQQGYERYPAQYAEQQYRTQFGTQQQAQGDPLAGYTNDDFVLWLANERAPMGDTSQPNQLLSSIRASLVARYMRQGYDPQRAADLAVSDLVAIRAKAEAAKKTAAGGSGAPPVVIQKPAGAP